MSAADGPIDGLRREIDEIDNALHDLLIRRSDVVARIGVLKGGLAQDSGNGSFLRPGREAVVLRRLVERHRGPLPKGAVIRIWRELVCDLYHLQGPFAVAVFSPDAQPGLWDLARDHFGSLTPAAAYETTGQVLRAIFDGQATVAVMPVPQQEEDEPWWRHLLNRDAKTPRVIARLPFGVPGSLRGAPMEGLVLGLAVHEKTGRDRSLFVIETTTAVSRSGLSTALKAAEIEAVNVHIWRDRSDPSLCLHLVEAEGFLQSGDPQLATLATGRNLEVRQIWPLGGYAIPFAAADLGAGK